MSVGQERRKRYALGGKRDKLSSDALEVPPREQTLAEVTSEGAVDLDVEVRRNGEPLVDQ
jgi:hypothetical protein